MELTGSFLRLSFEVSESISKPVSDLQLLLEGCDNFCINCLCRTEEKDEIDENRKKISRSRNKNKKKKRKRTKTRT